MRKLIYHVAASLDGFIAHEDHTVDGFINEGDHATDYFASLKNDYDTVLMGRKTYDFGLQFGVTNPYPWLKQYVFSSRQDITEPGITVISSDPSELVTRLKAETGKSIYLCGGAKLATGLLEHHLIDEILVKINPVLFGAGIGLTRALPRFLPLELKSSKTYANGVLLVHYTVKPKLNTVTLRNSS
jgi:dihydrofolate reductase